MQTIGLTSNVADWVNAKLFALAMEVDVALAFLLPTVQVSGTPSLGTSHLITDLILSPGFGSSALRLPIMLSPYSRK